MKKRTIEACIILISMFIIFSCNLIQKEKINSTETFTLSDCYVQKGPFIQGSDITIQELNDNFDPIGGLISTTTNDDFGSFEITSQMNSKYIEIISNGYYFNEVSGSISNSPIQLRVITDLKTESNVNINLLTTLEKNRVIYLINNLGYSFIDAKSQATNEILHIFNIPEEYILNISRFEDLDISKGGDNNAILLAITVILQGNNTVGELSELISKISSDIEIDGTLDDIQYINELKNNAINLNLSSIRHNLESRYSQLGVSVIIPNFEDFIDSDGDSLINKQDISVDFAPVINAQLNTEYRSNEVTIVFPEDIETGTITVTEGSLVLNGINTGLQIEEIINGDTIAIELTSSNNYETDISSIIEISYQNFSLITQFDITTKKLSLVQMTPMNSPRQLFELIEYNNNIYSIGGVISGIGTILNSLEVYDPNNDVWSELSPMITGRYRFFGGVYNDELYVFGGSGENTLSTMNQMEKYNFESDTWTTLPTPLNNSRSDLSGVFLNDRFYLIGGQPTLTIDEYNPETGEWRTMSSTGIGRQSFTVEIINDKIYLLGGWNDISGSTLNLIEEFDPANDMLLQKTEMIEGLQGHSSCVLGDCLYIFGGSTDGGQTQSKKMWKYNTTIDLWNQIGNMEEVLYNAKSISTEDNIYIMGGESAPDNTINSVQLLEL